MQNAPFDSSSRLKRAAAASIAVAVVVLALKYLAYWYTGSVALYSDALESIVNLITAAVALYAIHVSSQPADRRHQFGHHKAEYFSAVLEGVLIVVAALLIFREAYAALLVPRSLDAPLIGIAYNALATALNAGWSYVLLTWGRRQRSPALVGDGWHLVSDVVTSVGVLLGLGLATLTGWRILDPALAIAVAANILWAGWRVMRDSMSGLMDEAVTAEVARQIRAVISSNAEGAIEAHDVKTRMAGRATFIEFHLVVPGTMTVATSHQICDRLEAALTQAIHGAEVLIHVEPEDEAKQSGVPVL
ncbi:MAG TPA: cation diffusion facilitator family transporter [Hyphomicrobiaceae bacterium]|jgi:cation diffusion facilitator family transporter|nr:cation diffusion facilitator family transporter [Hyphomicrobiaceae bacterium]